MSHDLSSCKKENCKSNWLKKKNLLGKHGWIQELMLNQEVLVFTSIYSIFFTLALFTSRLSIWGLSDYQAYILPVH